MSNYKDQNPEIILRRLNRRLMKLLQTLAPLNDEDLDKSLIGVIRSTIVAELLHKHVVVAVAGTQGAGKTLLIRELLMPAKINQPDGSQNFAYPLGALDWLEPNIGRGEKVPLLILERPSCKEPEARMISLKDSEWIEEKIERREDFQRSLKGLSGNELCPLLVVPPSVYGGNEAGFVLLPGYEKIDASNSGFQEFMRQTLISAGTAIIVTDEKLLAGNRNSEILEDLRKNFLEGSKPIIAIARTESDNHEQRENLRETACNKMNINKDEINRVVCVGTDDFVSEWKPLLRNAINDYHIIGNQARSRQIDNLAKVLRHAGTVLNEAERAIRINELPKSANNRSVQSILDAFDDAKNKLQQNYERSLGKLVKEFYAQASKEIDRQAEVKGLDRIKNYINDVITADPAIFIEQRNLIEQNWRNSKKQTFSEAHFDLLTDVTLGAYGQHGAAVSIADTKDKTKLLAYDGLGSKSNAEVENTGMVRHIEPEVMSNLNAIFDKSSKDDTTPDSFESAVKILPILALELGRMASLSSSLLNQLNQTERPDLVELARQIEQDFSSITGSSSTVIKGIALMLGIDIVEDIPSLWGAITGSGTTATAGASTVAIGAALALVAVISIAVIVNQIKRRESDRYRQGHQIASAFEECYREHCIGAFEDIMRIVRDTLENRLENRYRLHEALFRLDRQTRVLADARSTLHEIQSIIHVAEQPSLV